MPLALALQLDPVHGTSTAYRGLAWTMEDNGKSPRPLHLPSLVTFLSYVPVVGLDGYCYGTTVVRIDSRTGRIVMSQHGELTH